jgi:hypothetical protein
VARMAMTLSLVGRCASSGTSAGDDTG